MTKNRALVSGTGKKPWRQKGTGRARVGEARNPLWRHGGTVFGPTPRDYSYRMPGKTRMAALRSALSLRLKEGAVRVIDRFGIDTPKTARLRAILDTLGVRGKAVLVDARARRRAGALGAQHARRAHRRADAPDGLRRPGLPAPGRLAGRAGEARSERSRHEEPLRSDPPAAAHREVDAAQGDAALAVLRGAPRRHQARDQARRSRPSSTSRSRRCASPTCTAR